MTNTVEGISLFCVNLCSWGDTGDWEVFPAEELDLRLENLVDVLSERGWKVIAFNESVVLAELGERRITLFRSGRIIIERVRPDSKDAALRSALDILS